MASNIGALYGNFDLDYAKGRRSANHPEDAGPHSTPLLPSALQLSDGRLWPKADPVKHTASFELLPPLATKSRGQHVDAFD